MLKLWNEGRVLIFHSVFSRCRVRASWSTDKGVTAEPKNWFELEQNIVLISESEKKYFLEKQNNGKTTSSILSISFFFKHSIC